MPQTPLPVRKPNRLLSHDYSAPGAYFITFCTANRQNMLWQTETAELSASGRIVQDSINRIESLYPAVTVDHYAIMPNHVHLLLQIHADECGRAQTAPTVSNIVRQLKGCVTKQTGQSLWQKLFHDHIIRSEADYLQIWQYIDQNPAQWQEDCFYQPD